MAELRKIQTERNVKNLKKGQLTPTMQDWLDKYVNASKKQGKLLTTADCKLIGFPWHKLQQYFGNLENLQEAAFIQYPELHEIEIQDQILDSAKTIAKQTKNYKRFIITCAVSGSPLHQGFYAAIKQYCKKNKAKLIVIPAGKSTEQMPPELVDETWCLEKHYLNSNIYISDIRPAPKTINPLTGIGRVGQRNGSTVVGSPKQFLEYVAVGDNKMPHAVMSTGAITEPDYYSAKGEKRKVDIMAAHDHVTGAIIVEIQDDKFYHFRQIQAEKCGAFVDLGVRYDGKKVTKMPPAAFYIGDYHVGDTDPDAAKAWDEIQRHTGVRVRVHGDVFDGRSINHHEWEDEIRRASLMGQGFLNLEQEIKEVASFLKQEAEKCDRVYIVASNHHDFLDKYLSKGMYRKDPQNLEFASKLISPAIKNIHQKQVSVLQTAVEMFLDTKTLLSIKWLPRDSELKVAGIELSAHGDKGANGSKGSPNTLEKAYGNCVVGHSHTPKIVRGFWQVGTSTYLRLRYTEGSSSWVQSSCLVYTNGSRQLINCIGGKWRA